MNHSPFLDKPLRSEAEVLAQRRAAIPPQDRLVFVRQLLEVARRQAELAAREIPMHTQAYRETWELHQRILDIKGDHLEPAEEAVDEYTERLREAEYTGRPAAE